MRAVSTLQRQVARRTPSARVRARLPDLVLIDGGKGQVGMAREVFTALGLDLARIVGVEKGEGRKVGLEELVFADGRDKVYLGKDSAALMLVAQIRDEAHRFAITGMRAARAKVRVGGQSGRIPGIRPQEARPLSCSVLVACAAWRPSVEDIATVEGISRELAKRFTAPCVRADACRQAWPTDGWAVASGGMRLWSGENARH